MRHGTQPRRIKPAALHTHHCADCGGVTSALRVAHQDQLCTHCWNVRCAVATTGTYDGPLFPDLAPALPLYGAYRAACELHGGTLRTLPLSAHAGLHDTWTALILSPAPCP